MSTHLSHMTAIEALTRSDGESKLQIEGKRLEHHILEQKLRTFRQTEDRRQNLGGLAVLQTWGLASLPKCSVVAACVNVRGGDMPIYTIPSKDASVIVFASEAGQDRFPWQQTLLVKSESATRESILHEVSQYWAIKPRKESAFSTRIAQAAGASRKLLKIHDNLGDGDELVERCSICSVEIPFSSLVEAACVRGHRFGMLQPLSAFFGTVGKPGSLDLRLVSVYFFFILTHGVVERY